jgi:hypothetical protein
MSENGKCSNEQLTVLEEHPERRLFSQGSDKIRTAWGEHSKPYYGPLNTFQRKCLKNKNELEEFPAIREQMANDMATWRPPHRALDWIFPFNCGACGPQMPMCEKTPGSVRICGVLERSKGSLLTHMCCQSKRWCARCGGVFYDERYRGGSKRCIWKKKCDSHGVLDLNDLDVMIAPITEFTTETR